MIHTKVLQKELLYKRKEMIFEKKVLDYKKCTKKVILKIPYNIKLALLFMRHIQISNISKLLQINSFFLV